MTEKKKKASTKKTAKKTSGRSVRSKSNREDTRVPIQLLVDYKADGHYLFDFCKDESSSGHLGLGSALQATLSIDRSAQKIYLYAPSL